MRTLIAVAALAALFGYVVESASAATEDFETPALTSTELAPVELVKGPRHTLSERVTLDGHRIIFGITSPLGSFQAPGLELLALRVAELPAIEALGRVHKGDAFVEALGKAAKAPLEFVGKMISDPGATLGHVASGVGQVVGKAGNLVRSSVETLADGASDLVSTSDTATVAAVAAGGEEEPPAFTSDPFGYNKARRQWAKTLNVDPYTSNPALRQLLDEAASATFAGSFAVDTTLGLVAAPVKFAVGFDTESRDAVWDLSPGDIEIRNESRLRAMGIEGRTVRDFFRNRWFTPTLQTALVDALEKLTEVDGRGSAIEAAAQVRGEIGARGLIAALNLLGNYHRKVLPLVALRPSGAIVLATSREGGSVVASSADYLYWSSVTASMAAFPAPIGAGRTLLLFGKASPRARDELQRAGWQLLEGFRPEPRLERAV